MSSFLNRRRRHRQTAHEHGEPPSHRCAGQLIGSYGLVPSVQALERAQNVLFSTKSSMRVPCVDTDRTRSFPVSYPRSGSSGTSWIGRRTAVGTSSHATVDRIGTPFGRNSGRGPDPLKERACVLLRILFLLFWWIKAERREEQPLDPGLTGRGWPRGPVILTDAGRRQRRRRRRNERRRWWHSERTEEVQVMERWRVPGWWVGRNLVRTGWPLWCSECSAEFWKLNN